MEYQTNNRAYGRMTCGCGAPANNGAVRAFRPYEHVCPADARDTTPEPEENCCRRSLAMVYPEVQKWGETFTRDEALTAGTLFKSLYLPFLAAGTTPRGGSCR